MIEVTPWIRTFGAKTAQQYVGSRFGRANDPNRSLNHHIDVSIPTPESRFFQEVVTTLADWVTRNNVAVLTSSNERAKAFVKGVGAHKPGLPRLAYRRHGHRGFMLIENINSALSILQEDDNAKVGIIHDELTSGRGLDEFARMVTLLLDRPKHAVAIVDRGQAVPGITTAREAMDYRNTHPNEPPAYMAFDYPVDIIIPLRKIIGPPESV